MSERFMPPLMPGDLLRFPREFQTGFYPQTRRVGPMFIVISVDDSSYPYNLFGTFFDIRTGCIFREGFHRVNITVVSRLAHSVG